MTLERIQEVLATLSTLEAAAARLDAEIWALRNELYTGVKPND